MAQSGKSFSGHGGPKGGTPGGGRFGAGQVPGPQVQANLDNHSVQVNQGGSAPQGGTTQGGAGASAPKK